MAVLLPTPSRRLAVPSWKTAALVIGGLLLAQMVALLGLGRLPICACGDIKLWHGITHSAENSQHLTDWYTLSHVVHGFLFYVILRLVLPSASLPLLLVLAVAIETSWEVIENTSFVIERYRAETISLNYFGDSIVNSLVDTVAMIAGFAAASWIPAWLSVILVVLLEIVPLIAIRDNLTLNIIMLLYPFEMIHQWQAGSPSA